MKAIIAVDDSPMTETVIENVIARRWSENTQFKVLTVIEPLCVATDLEEDSDSLIRIYEKRRANAAKWCAKLRERLEANIPGAQVHFEVRKGAAPRQILDAAVEWSADKILIGAHAQDVCPHHLVGGVSRRVSNHAPCSVEIIRSKVRSVQSIKVSASSNAPSVRGKRDKQPQK